MEQQGLALQERLGLIERWTRAQGRISRLERILKRGRGLEGRHGYRYLLLCSAFATAHATAEAIVAELNRVL